MTIQKENNMDLQYRDFVAGEEFAHTYFGPETGPDVFICTGDPIRVVEFRGAMCLIASATGPHKETGRILVQGRYVSPRFGPSRAVTHPL